VVLVPTLCVGMHASTLRVELTLMNLNKLFFAMILMLMPSMVSSTQASILDALRAGISRSHALRGNACTDAPRYGDSSCRTRSVLAGIPTQSVGTRDESGHGRRAPNGHPFFVTNKGGLSWKKLAKWLGKIKARTLVLLDACRAGDVAGIDNQSLVTNLIGKRDTGILVFSAARSWQNTYEWDGMGNSIFAKAISNAFDEKVDINQDGVITLSEFYKHNHYMLVNVGWHDDERISGCVLHLDIKDGKIIDKLDMKAARL